MTNHSANQKSIENYSKVEISYYIKSDCFVCLFVCLLVFPRLMVHKWCGGILRRPPISVLISLLITKINPK